MYVPRGATVQQKAWEEAGAKRRSSLFQLGQAVEHLVPFGHLWQACLHCIQCLPDAAGGQAAQPYSATAATQWMVSFPWGCPAAALCRSNSASISSMKRDSRTSTWRAVG